jgi:DNA-binding SARP family transcriptional activator
MLPQAKISVPQAHGLISRKRLHPRLSPRGGRRIVWIVGPPGAGKTCLALDYLRQREARCLWYQIGERDGDPASCLRDLEAAARRLSRRRTPHLPWFGPENAQNLAAFARCYFEALFARLPEGCVLVLDNYQDLAPEAPTQVLFREAMAVLPPDRQILVLSRQGPPAACARFQAEGRLEVIPWEDLRMTGTEAKALLRTRLPAGTGGPRLSELCRLAEGWPAGLVLMAAEGRRAPALDPGGRSREALFAYFASEVLERAEPALRTLLLQVSVMPRCTAAQAQRLTGQASAGRSLMALVRAGYFTVAHGQADPVFEFHPLFREFLRHRAQETHPGEAWRELLGRAGGLLERDGAFPEAFELYREAGLGERQAGLILAQAPAMLAQARHQTLLGWLRSLPPSLVDGQPFLSLWLGSCLLTCDIPQARERLVRAFEAFGQAAHLAGQMLAWCAVVDTWLFAWDDYSRLDPWIRWLDAQEARLAELDPATLEMVTLHMAWAIVHREPSHPRAHEWIRRSEALLDSGSHPQVRLRAGTAAFMFRFWSGDLTACEGLAANIHRMAQTLHEPMALITSYWVESGMRTWTGASPERCRALNEAGLALGERVGIHFFDFMFHGHAAALAMGCGDPGAARTSLEAMRQCLPGRNGQGFFHYLSGCEAFLGGDLAAAVAHAEKGSECSEASGMPTSEALNRLALAELYFEAGRREEAGGQARRVEALLERACSPFIGMLYHQGMARRGLQASPREPGALAHLREALALGREHQFVHHHYWQIRSWMTGLCSIALEEGIETAFAQRLIAAHGLVPAEPLLHPGWPWELRVTTLGRFAIHRKGKELAFSSKAPWKVLLLLKALVAAGQGGISGNRLADWLWPDAEGDTAQQSLETGLHRLRQLLGVEGAVLLRDGHVALDPARCWVDVHAFEAMSDHGDRQETALALYRGPFLPDLDQPWARQYRDRMAERFVKGILARGLELEERDGLRQALALYERGLEADPLSESLHRRAISCHGRMGERAEGLRAFERCRAALRHGLDVEPSAETLRLASALQGA